MTDTTPQDLLYGTRRIAEFLGIPRRIAEHLVETKRIPYFKMGKIVCARRTKLTETMERLEEMAD
jgi:excisionase family DNA binding protein